MASKYANHPVYQREYAARIARGMDPATAHVFAFSRARWATAMQGMSAAQAREFIGFVAASQQETWNREEGE